MSRRRNVIDEWNKMSGSRGEGTGDGRCPRCRLAACGLWPSSPPAPGLPPVPPPPARLVQGGWSIPTRLATASDSLAGPARLARHSPRRPPTAAPSPVRSGLGPRAGLGPQRRDAPLAGVQGAPGKAPETSRGPRVGGCLAGPAPGRRRRPASGPAPCSLRPQWPTPPSVYWCRVAGPRTQVQCRGWATPARPLVGGWPRSATAPTLRNPRQRWIAAVAAAPVCMMAAWLRGGCTGAKSSGVSGLSTDGRRAGRGPMAAWP